MNESMPILTFKGQTYSCEPGETVLGCLLRHQQAIPHGCLAGVCQSCCLQSHRVPTERLVEAQQGLSEAQCRNGEFLACQLPADHSLEVSLPAQKPWHTATLARSEQLSDTVWRLEFDSSLRWQPGQYFSLSLNGIDTRCYSAALPASQGPLVFHIQRHPEGRLSDALCRLSAGDTLQLQGPFGDFRLREDSTPRRLLLIGSGTGLAPLAQRPRTISTTISCCCAALAAKPACMSHRSYPDSSIKASILKQRCGTTTIVLNPPCEHWHHCAATMSISAAVRVLFSSLNDVALCTAHRAAISTRKCFWTSVRQRLKYLSGPSPLI